MAEKITKRQQELLDFLRRSQNENGLMPSTREIQAHFGFASQTAAMSHLRALERKGVIVRLPGKARAVVFPEDLEREEVVDIPIFGSIAAEWRKRSRLLEKGVFRLISPRWAFLEMRELLL